MLYISNQKWENGEADYLSRYLISISEKEKEDEEEGDVSLSLVSTAENEIVTKEIGIHKDCCYYKMLKQRRMDMGQKPCEYFDFIFL